MAISQGAHIDAILEELGWFGRYSKLQFCLALSYTWAAATHMLSIVFLARSVEHKCATPIGGLWDNLTYDANNTRVQSCFIETVSSDNSSHRLSSCAHGFAYLEPRERSIVSDWDLVCENGPLGDLLQTLMTAGTGLGSLLFPPLADRFGRRPVYLITSFGMMATGVSIAFSPNYVTFAILRFLHGTFQQGCDLVGILAAIELMVTRRRMLAVMTSAIVYAASISLLVPVAYAMREHSWRHLELAICLTSLPAFLCLWLCDESLRWLAANGRFKEFERILKKAARMNGKDEKQILALFRECILPSSAVVLTVVKPEDTAAEDVTEGEAAKETDWKEETPEPAVRADQYGFLTIFRHKEILIILFLTCFMWLVTVLTYFGLSLTSTMLLDDPYLGFLVTSLMDLPVAFVLILLNRFGRQRCSFVFMLTSGLSLLTAVTLSNFADSGPILMTSVAFTLLGKFAISNAFSTLHLYTPELFPTNVRNAASGLSSLAGRLGGMAAPFSRSLMRTVKWAPGVLFGVLCLVAAFCTCFLPETKGRELPQTPQDMAVCRRPSRRRSYEKSSQGVEMMKEDQYER